MLESSGETVARHLLCSARLKELLYIYGRPIYIKYIYAQRFGLCNKKLQCELT
jgi:hypothetical protein